MGANVNRREATALRHGTSLLVTLPADWVRGNGIKAGDRLVVEYGDVVTVRTAKPAGGSG